MSVAGRVTELHRYPVKSLRGETLDRVTVSKSGLAGDRRYGLRDVETQKVLSGKNARLGRALLSCCSTTAASGDVIVQVGEDRISVKQKSQVEAALSRCLSRPVALEERRRPGDVYESWWPEIKGTALSDVTVDLPIAMSTEAATFVDLAALHVLSTNTLSHLGRLLGAAPPDVARFRPNMVVEVDDADRFVENDWVGRRARLGSAVIEFTAPTPRCVMTVLPQGDLDEDRLILRTIASRNRVEVAGMHFAGLGAYAEVIEQGEVAVGDSLAWL